MACINRMNENYVRTIGWKDQPSSRCITSIRVDPNDNRISVVLHPRCRIPGLKPWVKVPSVGTSADAGSGDSGLYVTDMTNCISITLIDLGEWERDEGRNSWESARMALVGIEKDPLLTDPKIGFYDGYVHVPSNDLRVVNLDSLLLTLLGFLPNLHGCNIIIFTGEFNRSMSVGVTALRMYDEA